MGINKSNPTQAHFNSSMVRLKVFAEKEAMPLTTIFQFLNGSIKSEITIKNNTVFNAFQFLNGSIKSTNARCDSVPLP